MKTAVSIPDDVFDAAEKTAAELGISRSRLVTEAVSEYLRRHQSERVTARLNRVYGKDRSGNELGDGSLESLRELTSDDSW